jgi:diadenosine tetraphosphate (Ap4A) HIT family hydrolase
MNNLSSSSKRFVRKCPYCASIFGHTITDSLWNSRVLPDVDGVAIVPTRGMLVPGWLLIVPEEHILSVQQLPEGRGEAVWRRATEARDLLTPIFGAVTMFEHGATKSESPVGCGVDHAHLHVVPLQFDLLKAARAHPLGGLLRWHEVQEKACWSDGDLEEPYLWLSSPTSGEWIARGPIPSQFFRRVIAREIGKPESFDWRDDDGVGEIQYTHSRLNPMSVAEG